jgi:hypothetical protein
MMSRKARVNGQERYQVRSAGGRCRGITNNHAPSIYSRLLVIGDHH